MTSRRLSAYIDAVAAGRRPRWRNGEPGPHDVAVMRTAIELRAARPGDSSPDKDFVRELHRELADEFDPSQPAKVEVLRSHRGRAVLLAAAAAVALVGGTVVVTEAASHSGTTNVALQAPHVHMLRIGTFENRHGQVLGQIVVYQGHPSWVYMNVKAVNSYSSVRCELHLTNGSVVAAGIVHLQDGEGELSHTVNLGPHRLRGATLYGPSGAVLGSASLA